MPTVNLPTNPVRALVAVVPQIYPMKMIGMKKTMSGSKGSVVNGPLERATILSSRTSLNITEPLYPWSGKRAKRAV